MPKEGEVVSPDIDAELLKVEWSIFKHFLNSQKESDKNMHSIMEDVMGSSIYTAKLLSILLFQPVSS